MLPSKSKNSRAATAFPLSSAYTPALSVSCIATSESSTHHTYANLRPSFSSFLNKEWLRRMCCQMTSRVIPGLFTATALRSVELGLRSSTD
jgi:hypothetical protein